MAYLARTAGQPAPTLDGFTPEQRVFSLGSGVVRKTSAGARAHARANQPALARPRRVNGVVANMQEFQKGLRVQADAPMVRKNQCRVW